jgi:hypothetical protein
MAIGNESAEREGDGFKLEDELSNLSNLRMNYQIYETT